MIIFDFQTDQAKNQQFVDCYVYICQNKPDKKMWVFQYWHQMMYENEQPIKVADIELV
jgi:hypothetical protein